MRIIISCVHTFLLEGSMKKKVYIHNTSLLQESASARVRPSATAISCRCDTFAGSSHATSISVGKDESDFVFLCRCCAFRGSGSNLELSDLSSVRPFEWRLKH